MQQIDVLIAGAGLAGSRCAETLRASGFEGSVVVCGDEPHAPYERPALSKELLSGQKDACALALRAPAFWAGRGITLRLGEPLDRLDLEARTAHLGGEPARWRHLVLATGAAPRRLPMIPPAANVHHLRRLDDAAALAGDLVPGARLVIIGSGFVGAEVASSALGLGAAVAIVETLPVPFGTTLGQAVGRRLAERYRACGVDLHLGQGVSEVALRDGRVAAVGLTDGTFLDCDALLVAVGTRPSAGLVEGILDLAPDGGVPTDALGATDAPGVFACGDVASPWRHALGRHQRLEHWTAAATGGATVARTIMGLPSPPAPPPYFWSDQFGWRLQMVGHPSPGSDPVMEDRDGGFVARYPDGTGGVSAALAVNRPSDLGALREEVLAAPTPAARGGAS